MNESVEIVSYKPSYKMAFKELNQEWIEKYFKMEASDFQSLDHPEAYIINRGGSILVAIYENSVAGVCALLKSHDPNYQFELSKMAVRPDFQGKKIGWLLGKAIISEAIKLGAKAIFLESNTLLKPAINLYLKLGFTEVSDFKSPYARANIKMELKL